MQRAQVAAGLAAGILVAVYIGPIVYHAVFRACLFLACVAAIAAVTNPTEASFAQWLAVAHNQNMSIAQSRSMLSWMRSAIASWTLTEEDAASWVRHNMIIFTLVHVPSMERYALGCFGLWMWCDSTYALSWFTRQYGQSIAALTGGGSPSGLHMTAASTATSIPPPTHLANANALHSQCKYVDAADAYLEAAAVAGNRYSSLNYTLDAARCLAKSIDRHTSMHRVEKLFRDASEEHASAGSFDEAGRCLVELAECYAKKLSLHVQDGDLEIADVMLCRQSALYVEAARVFDAGDHIAAASSANLTAAAVYATQGMALTDAISPWRNQWLLIASQQYKAVGVRYHPSAVSKQAHMLSICCYVGMNDMEGARHAFCNYAEDLTSFEAPDHLLHGIFEAYEKWSPPALEAAIVAYEASDCAPMAAWQVSKSRMQQRIHH